MGPIHRKASILVCVCVVCTVCLCVCCFSFYARKLPCATKFPHPPPKTSTLPLRKRGSGESQAPQTGCLRSCPWTPGELAATRCSCFWGRTRPVLCSWTVGSRPTDPVCSCLEPRDVGAEQGLQGGPGGLWIPSVRLSSQQWLWPKKPPGRLFGTQSAPFT